MLVSVRSTKTSQSAKDWKGPAFLFVNQTLELDVGSRNWNEDLPVGRIEGTVSEPIEGSVTYFWKRQDGLSFMCSITPGSDGRFVLPAAAVGQGKLQWEVEASKRQTREVEVREGATLRVDL